MKINSSKSLFILMLIIGIMVTTSSNNWIMMWCGLEISLVSIIPLMISKLTISSESTMKYFIIQSISSSMLMMGMLIMIMSGDYNYDYMLMTALLVKMGVSPFHNWVLTVIEGLNYIPMLMLITINKMAPVTMMSYLMVNMNMIIVFTTITGAVLGLNQNSIKKLIGYSSIFNMGFILAIIKMNSLWILYLFIYSIILALFINLVNTLKATFINQMIFMNKADNKLSLWMNLLSMGGMPPLIGFSIKYMVMTAMLKMNMIYTISIMVMMSLLVMFMYLRMTFLSIMNFSVTNKTKLFCLNQTSMMVLMLNLSTLPIMLMSKSYF